MIGRNGNRSETMDIQEQHDRGLALREDMFGREAVEKRSDGVRAGRRGPSC